VAETNAPKAAAGGTSDLLPNAVNGMELRMVRLDDILIPRIDTSAAAADTRTAGRLNGRDRAGTAPCCCPRLATESSRSSLVEAAWKMPGEGLE